MARKENREAFNRIFCANYVGELMTGDGQPIKYSQAEEEKDWKTVEHAIDDLELYKKAFKKSCRVHIHTCIAHDLPSTNEGESGKITYVEEFENEMLEQARKEQIMENEIDIKNIVMDFENDTPLVYISFGFDLVNITKDFVGQMTLEQIYEDSKKIYNKHVVYVVDESGLSGIIYRIGNYGESYEEYAKTKGYA